MQSTTCKLARVEIRTVLWSPPAKKNPPKTSGSDIVNKRGAVVLRPATEEGEKKMSGVSTYLDLHLFAPAFNTL